MDRKKLMNVAETDEDKILISRIIDALSATEEKNIIRKRNGTEKKIIIRKNKK